MVRVLYDFLHSVLLTFFSRRHAENVSLYEVLEKKKKNKKKNPQPQWERSLFFFL